MGESVLSAVFGKVDGVLTCEGVSLETIAGAVGTPAYVYSAGAIREQYAVLSEALSAVPHRIHYSVKANSNLAILRLLRQLGAGVDIVSGGELRRSLMAGFDGADIVFSGVGKTAAELEDALRASVLFVNVESTAELQLLNSVASRLGHTARVALRINPEVSVATPHHYTRTGERGNKFGIPYDEALDAARLAASLPRLSLVGLDMHVGSQISQIEPYEQGMLRLLELLDAVRREGLRDIAYIDLGGGLGVTYGDERPMDIPAFASAILPSVAASKLSLIVEPGRFLVGNAGVLLTRVLYRKESGGRDYVITDAGMNDLLRPSHYNAFHEVSAVRSRGPRSVVDVVGPVCESGDFFALDREVDALTTGDLLVIRSAGAYGYVMSSNYNSRPRPAEVLVDGDRFAVVAERERPEDLTRLEPAEPQWRRD